MIVIFFLMYILSIIACFTGITLLVISKLWQTDWDKQKIKILVLVSAVSTVVIFILAGVTVGKEEVNTKNDGKEEQEVVLEEFNLDFEVKSEVIDGDLMVEGKTNLPDKTLLVLNLKDKDDNEKEVEFMVNDGEFNVKVASIAELKEGKQTLNIVLAEEQLVTVASVIGATGEALKGDYVDKNKVFTVSLDVDIEKEKVVSNKEETKKKSTTETSQSSKKEKVQTEVKKKPTHTSGTTDKIPVKLVKTVDGDTIKVIYDGQEHNVRYLLIDTPETNHPKLGKQPYGEEAKERNKQLVNSGTLYLEFDVGERFDKYGRLLAYVYVGDTLVQEKLLKEGLARVAYVYPPNTRYLNRLEKAEKTAKDKKIGIWSKNGYVTSEGFNSDKVDSKKTTSGNKQSTTSKSTSKANSSGDSKSSNSTRKIETKSKETTKSSDVYYKNCTEVREAGVAPIYKGEPGYAKHLDRDGDGVGCE